MSSDSNLFTRRKILKGAGAAGSLALAGCTGSDGGGGGGENAWPPGNGNIEVLIPVGPGDSRDVESRTLGSMWERASPEVTGSEISVRYTNNAGAGGLINHNRAWNAEPNGATTNNGGSEAMYMLQVADPNAEFKTRDFRAFDITRQKPRGLQISHHSTEVSGHFQWGWDKFVSEARNLTLGASSPHQQISMKTLLEYADETDQDDIEFVNFGSGSEVRAEVMAGNLDGYVGGYGTNMPRAEYYKTQFAFNSENMYPNLYQQMIDQVESLYGVGDKFQALGDFDLSKKALTNSVEVSNGATAMYCPPDTPDSIMQVYYDMVEWGYGDASGSQQGNQNGSSTASAQTGTPDELESHRDKKMYQEMRKARGDENLNEMVFSQIRGAEATDLVESKAEVFLDTKGVRQIIKENIG